MLTQERTNFVLKTDPTMMFFLAFYIALNLIKVGLAHRKIRVPSLPLEIR